jgi:glycosyltransferase involved in cell wall biosynthesis
MPKFTICIPTFNRAHFLPFAIDSVFAQTELDWELMICDDGSTDGTPELMQRYTDKRVYYLRHPQNVGKSNNMRSGFEAATGDYFIKFDDDDRITPEFLAKAGAVLDQHPEIDFVGTDHWVIDPQNQRDEIATEANSRKWGRSDLAEGVPADLLGITFVHQSFQIGATLFRRRALLDVGYMRPNIQNCEDNDLLVRLAMTGKKGYYLPERLMEYRFHPEQQGIGRAIPYLKDKLTYLENFEFTDEEIEAVRQWRVAETKLLLGLRLIEQGETSTGRELVQAGRAASPSRAIAGLAFSILPMGMRKQAFAFVRRGG